VFPHDLDVRPDPRGVQEIDRALAHYLVGDVDFAALCLRGVGNVNHSIVCG
jgi:hypothetical protein